jgi:hypothetical protein
MKIFSDVSQVSALDTWLRETNAGATMQPASLAPEGVSDVAAPNATSTLHDTAEDLLNLDLWSDAPAASRQLVATATESVPTGAQTAGSAQSWADYIVRPLL